MMHFSSFSRVMVRTAQRRRRPIPGEVTNPPAPARRRAAMGIEVQPVHGHHCICQRCQRDGVGR